MECPYCKAAISNEAIKCRYCGGWMTRDGSLINNPSHSVYHSTGPVTPSVEPPVYQPRSTPPPQPYYAPPPNYGYPPQPSNVNVIITKPESPTFAIITLLMYLVAPLLFGITGVIAFILNIVGMITGPKKGCFVQLFIFFIILPVVITIALFIIAQGLLYQLINSLIDMLPY